MELDHFDRQLLNLVQQDAAQTASALAQRVALSPSAIQRRLRRLREAGVIEREVALVDWEAAGRPTTFIMALEVENERPEVMAGLRQWIAGQDGVQQAFYVTGSTDFILIVTAPDTQAYEALTANMLRDNPCVRRFTTHVALGVIKRGLHIQVPEMQTGRREDGLLD